MACGIDHSKELSELRQLEFRTARKEQITLDIIKSNIILRETMGIYTLRELRDETKKNLNSKRVLYKNSLKDSI